MWTTKTKIVPIIITTIRTFKNGLDQNLQLLLGHQSARATENHTNHSQSAG